MDEPTSASEKPRLCNPAVSVKLALVCDDVPHQEQLKAEYSIFTPMQKRNILFLVSFAASFSTLSSFIFFPAITPLANSLHTTVGNINLSVTSYLVMSAVAPSIVGNIADISGRRPLLLFCLTTYFVANIGLAIQGSFPALLLLRMLQSAGISGMLQYNKILAYSLGNYPTEKVF